MRRLASIASIIAAVSAAPAALAEENQQLPASSDRHSGEVAAGLDYQEGDYGTGAKVETLSASLGAAGRSGRVRFAASVPYLRTTAPVDVIVSQGGLLGTPLLATGSAQTVRTRREGIGDVTLQAAYDLPVTGFSAAIGGGLKLPTASRAKGLGTGKLDYDINAQIAKPLGRITPFAAVGYTIMGQPEGFAVRNTLSGTAGTRFALAAGTSAAISYSYEQSASRTLADRQSIGLGLGIALGQKLQLGLQGAAGLSRGAPDVKLGVRLGAGF